MNLALRRMGHEVVEIWQTELGRRIRHGNLHYLLELPRAFRRSMRNALERQTFDVIEFNQPHAYLAAADFQRGRHHGVFVNRSHGHEVRMWETLAPWQATLEKKRKFALRGLFSDCLRPWLDRQWTMIARSADGFHVSCREDAQFLIDRYHVSANRIGVISQGIPDSFLQVPLRPMADERRNRMLYVGQYSFFKAPMLLTQIVEQLLTERPNLTMTWICSRVHHSDVRSLLSSQVQSRVTLSDWRPQEELIQVFDEHGLFLFPSLFEGFGKAPLEAMSRGLCVIASDAGGMRDFIENGRTGRLIPIGRVDLFVQAALELRDNADKSQAMSIEAHKSASRHTWDWCARELTGFYQRQLENKVEDSR